MIALLAGPVGKVVGVGVLILALLAIGGRMVREHDNRVMAEQRAEAQAKVIADMQADHARTVSALEQETARAATLARDLSQTRSAINAAPHTAGCASSPAVAAAIDGLRSKPAPGH